MTGEERPKRKRTYVPPSFEERTMSMVRNLLEYGYYGKSQDRAVKILHQHHPERSTEECARTFNHGCNAYRDGVGFVDEHKEDYRQYYRNKRRDPRGERAKAEAAFCRAHRAVPARLMRNALYWIFFWHHLK